MYEAVGYVPIYEARRYFSRMLMARAKEHRKDESESPWSAYERLVPTAGWEDEAFATLIRTIPVFACTRNWHMVRVAVTPSIWDFANRRGSIPKVALLTNLMHAYIRFIVNTWLILPLMILRRFRQQAVREARNLEAALRLMRSVWPIAGMPMAIQESDIATLSDWAADIVRYRSTLGGGADKLDSELDEDEAQQATLGRPPKIFLARRAYATLYPEGHTGFSWKEVARAVSEEAGQTISVDTIKRALALRG